MFKKELWVAVFTFVGLIIGAGIFAIPYVFSKAGFLTGLVDIAILSLVILYVCLCYGEIVLRTKEKHQLTGLAEKYLGKEGKWIVFVSILVSLYGALMAYAIGAGTALTTLFGWEPIYWSVIFLLVFGTVIFFRLKVFAAFESIFTPLKLLVIFILIMLALPFVKSVNLMSFNVSLLHIPYGVLLFALTGFSVIPDMASELKDKKLLKKAIIIGIALSAVIYLLFAFSIVGVLGSKTSEIGTVALGQELGNYMVWLANIFAILALGTAFVAVGFTLKEHYVLDYKINNKLALFAVLIVPLVFIFLGKFSFVKIIDVSGIVGTGIALLAILIMHTRAIKQGDLEPAYKIKNYLLVKGLIILLLVIGIVYEFFRTLG